MDQIKRRPAVFISHSGYDEFLDKLHRHLQDYDVIISDWKDKAGTSLANKVQADISWADLVVVVLTPTAASSAWVNQEIGFARALGKKILPIVEKDVEWHPALLADLEWATLEPDAIDKSALRIAVRIGNWLQEDLTRIFKTYHEYREWWAHVDELTFTREKCYWATPHDTWSWIMSHVDESYEAEYRTLIRGDYEFDRKTIEAHYEGAEAVCGVQDLSAYEEIAVMGSLSVLTIWDPAFMRSVDSFLERMPSLDALFRWYKVEAHKQTTVEVHMYLNEGLASRHRQRLDALYKQYSSHPSSTLR